MALWIDDQMPSAASTIAAGNAAIGAWTRMSAWCAAQLADGLVPTAVARTMASRRELAALVVAGLLAEQDDAYLIVDYLVLNPSRELVLSERERRSASGRTAAHARWGRCDSHAPCIATASDPASPPHRKPDAPIPSHPIPSPERESAAPAASPPRPSRRRPETPAPASTAAGEEVDAWCASWGIPSPTADAEAAKMIDHARSQDRRCRDWGAAWANWQRRAAEFGRRPTRGPGGQPVDPDAPWLRPEGT